MTEARDPAPRTWRDFPRPADEGYYEERSSFLTQGDIVGELPLLLVSPELQVLDGDGEQVIAAVPVLETAAMIVTPTCDFRRASAEHLAAHPEEQPYTLRQQVVVARLLPFDEWERAVPASGRSDRVRQARSHDNQRQYMFLPALDGSFGESMVDLGTLWTLPLGFVTKAHRLTQLAEPAAVQLQYKLVLYGSAMVVDRDQLRPPLD